MARQILPLIKSACQHIFNVVAKMFVIAYNSFHGGNLAMTLTEIIKHYGSEREAAYHIGYSVQAFHHWRKRKRVPYKAQKLIEALTKNKLKAQE